MDIPIIETERLRLRGWQLDDLDAFSRLNANADFIKYLGNGKPVDRAESFRVMAMIAGHWHLRGYGLWLVEDKHTAEFIGRIGLIQFEGWPALELGWGIHPEHNGHGYATEAAQACAHWAFTELNTEALIHIIDPRNNASKAVAERLGSSFDRNEFVKDRHCDIYRITRQQFYQHNQGVY